MTTIPGHNNILPQSTLVQELNHQTHALKPGPDQAAAIQQAQQNVQNTSVQGSDESERLKKEREKKKARQEMTAKNREKKKQKSALALDPDSTGRLLDTTV